MVKKRSESDSKAILHVRQQDLLKAPASDSFQIGIAHPHVGAALTQSLLLYQQGTTAERQAAIANILEEKAERSAQSPDGAIAILQSQLEVLNTAFNKFLSLAALAKDAKSAEMYVGVAFRAQDSARKTALAIAELRNPKRATFIKRQQNNLLLQGDSLCTDTFQLERSHHAQVDFGVATTTAGTDSDLETVDVFDRATQL